MDYEKISSYEFMLRAFREYDRQHLAEHHKGFGKTIAEETSEFVKEMLEIHKQKHHEQHFHISNGTTTGPGIDYIPDDPPTRTSSTADPCKCDHPCHKYPFLYFPWRFCSYCGKPLKAEKEE